MKTLIFGAGAIGVYIGGSLALAGHTVDFIERPAGAAHIRQHGLKLELENGLRTAPNVTVYTTPAEALAAGRYDFGLLALKSFDLAAASAELRAAGAPPPPLVCLMNGVDNEPALREIFGPQSVIAGTVTTSIGKPGLGQIVVERKRGLGLARGSALSVPLAEAFNAAGLNAHLYSSEGGMKWTKLFTNLAGNASAAILDLTVAEVFADQRLFALEMRLLRECLAVMRALGHPVLDLPGTPARALAFATRLPAGLAQPILQRAIGGGRGGKRPSFHIDLHGGRGQTEAAWLNGAVARHGQTRGVRAPVNAALADILQRLTDGRESLETYRRQPQALLSAIARTE